MWALVAAIVVVLLVPVVPELVEGYWYEALFDPPWIGPVLWAGAGASIFLGRARARESTRRQGILAGVLLFWVVLAAVVDVIAIQHSRDGAERSKPDALELLFEIVFLGVVTAILGLPAFAALAAAVAWAPELRKHGGGASRGPRWPTDRRL